MRIGIISPGFSAAEDDWCIPVLLNLVRELSARYDVDVFALRYPHHQHTYRVYGATVHALGGGLVSGARRGPLLGRAITQVARQHRVRRFDVLHAFWADEPGFVAATAGRLIGVPSVVSLMGGEMVRMPDIEYGGQLGRVNRRLVQIALRRATCITAGSRYLYQMASAHDYTDRLAMLPLGVDSTLFHSSNGTHDAVPLDGEVRLLHVASLVRVKDQHTLLGAMRKVVSAIPGVQLHIVGDGVLRSELEHLAVTLRLHDHVTFHGTVPHDRLPDYYRSAHLCVLSSRHEGQELVTLEAAACGRPTIGTAVGLVPDLAPASRAVPIGDYDALARALIETLQDGRTLTCMSQSCRQLVADRYTLNRTVNDLGVLYERLILAH